MVALGSRSQGICRQSVSPNHYHQTTMTKSNNDDTTLTEACLDLRQSTTKCSHYPHSEAVVTLPLHSLTEPTDVEDMVRLGANSKHVHTMPQDMPCHTLNW